MSEQPAPSNPSSGPSKSSVTSSVEENNMVYSVPTMAHGNIVDIMLKIMEPEGPRPMRNMRPSQKTHNCADRFYVEHHAGYEALGQNSRDKIQDVNTHNCAYPKMYDELNKKNSILKISRPMCTLNRITAVSSEHHTRRSCLKQRTCEDDDSNRIHFRSHSRHIHPKITKSKYSQRRYQTTSRVFRHDRVSMHKSCQCSTYIVPVEQRSVSLSTVTVNDIFVSLPSQEVCVAASSWSADSHAETSNVASPMASPVASASLKPVSKKPTKIDLPEKPPSSVPSASSYNTFLSMDHEPMVEEDE